MHVSPLFLEDVFFDCSKKMLIECKDYVLKVANKSFSSKKVKKSENFSFGGLAKAAGISIIGRVPMRREPRKDLWPERPDGFFEVNGDMLE